METTDPVKSFLLIEPYPTTTTSFKVEGSSINTTRILSLLFTTTFCVTKPINDIESVVF